ncbi:helix-turn-helix domain-containing protein [Nakamurella sp.]|uniref:helix-turn-helix domain-containing protein n=1 Tax=Nakamurella sp. TaxID=1869182 RepID=UPI0037830E6B
MAGVPTPPGDDGRELIEAVRPLVDRIGGRLIEPADVTAGDVALAWRGAVVAAVRLTPAGNGGADADAEPRADEGGLTGILADVQREFAQPLDELPRPEKQRAVRLLEEAGAFSYRKSVETVATALGVSRFTVYNYLNRDRP